MSAMERQMAAADTSACQALEQLSAVGGPGGQGPLAAAETALAKHEFRAAR